MTVSFVEVLDDAWAAVVARLAVDIWPEHFGPIIGLPQVEYMLRNFQSPVAITGAIGQGMRYFMVQVDRIPAGYLAFLMREDSQELFLSKFYLLLNYRGQGIGRVMMDFVRKSAAEHGLAKVVLNTNKKNVSTIRFYERMGFVVRCSDVKDIGSGFVTDDWVMEMPV